jgi:hypothetical protein
MNKTKSIRNILIWATVPVALATTVWGIQSSASAKSEKTVCVDTTRWANSQGSSPVWHAGETLFQDFGTFKCDRDSTVSVVREQPDTGAYSLTQVFVGHSKDSHGLGGLKTMSDPLVRTFGITGVQEATDKLIPVRSNKEVEVFVGIRPEAMAHVWGIERQRVRVTFFDKSGNVIKSFNKFVDVGATAK